MIKPAAGICMVGFDKLCELEYGGDGEGQAAAVQGLIAAITKWGDDLAPCCSHDYVFLSLALGEHLVPNGNEHQR